jgi:hypothetical protein
MLDVRYLGIVLGRIEGELRAESELGSFVKLSETMPVGTVVEAGGARYLVRRVDENEGGCWLRSSTVKDAVPVAIAPDLTVREAPPPEALADAIPAATPDATPTETSGPSDEPRGRKRKNRKTTFGR